MIGARPLQRWLPLAALLSNLLPAVAGAQDKAVANDARAWLSRIHAAASTANYRGTMVFSAGGSLSSSRIWHYCVGDQTYEKLETLDGSQQRIVRHNDIVHTLWPQKRLALVEKRETLAAWPTLPQRVGPQVLDQYELRPEGAARVAGRDAAVFMLEPRDGLRYAQRLWADRASGLMLRVDVVGPGADRPVLESTAFTEIEIGARPQPEALLQSVRKLDDFRVLRPQQQRTTLEAEGWALARPVAGFTLAGCVKRGMETAGESEPVLQAVFTDGLTHVSVFLEPFQPRRHGGDAQGRRGATATLMRRQGDDWITAVGDVPPATLELLAAAIERRR